jgi:hypothetical protein
MFCSCPQFRHWTDASSFLLMRIDLKIVRDDAAQTTMAAVSRRNLSNFSEYWGKKTPGE